MGGWADIEQGFGRRSPRLRLGVPARLITPERTWPVTLEDLSTTGASITLSEADRSLVCVLRWMDYHAFADVAWRNGLSIGLQFDKPIPPAAIDATRAYFQPVLAQSVAGDPRYRHC